ncbi:hypothetical protein [Chelatococcus sp. HY11]|uniref:hypothetical protein n=1 Tax=Chelatococcus sp. HY11 TaxID=2835634 RepID=UPI001BCA73C2|nr:hypothetical protein [Chelatococcus sp. HY11]MBS7743536.1 hypothetical protein [Chelatococcus sp. HY11]CAH1664247.1 conserved hypothetical protein [Hyphomicrobiales bacterium]
MGDYPNVRANGAQIEIELERGFKLSAYVGDSNVAALLEELWSVKDSLAVRIALLEKHLREIDPRTSVDGGHIELLRGLRHQIGELEVSLEADQTQHLC